MMRDLWRALRPLYVAQILVSIVLGRCSPFDSSRHGLRPVSGVLTIMHESGQGA